MNKVFLQRAEKTDYIILAEIVKNHKAANDKELCALKKQAAANWTAQKAII